MRPDGRVRLRDAEFLFAPDKGVLPMCREEFMSTSASDSLRHCDAGNWKSALVVGAVRVKADD